jgi:hypothetical protein
VRIIDKSEQPAQHSQALGVQAQTLDDLARLEDYARLTGLA